MGILSDIGALIGVRFQALPQAAEDGDIEGDAIDRLQIESCVIAHACGEATGTPDSYTVDTKLQHSDTDVAEDFVDADLAADQLVGDSTSAYLDVNLGPLKRYIRLVSTVAFTGGTSPAVPVVAVVILGGSEVGSIA